MEATQVKTRADTFACIYENVKMGADSIINLLPKVQDSRLKSDMSVQMSGYEKFAARARAELREMGVEAQEKGMMTKAMAKIGMQMNTMADTSLSHIAEMMIQGSNMGIIEMNKCINACERGGCEDSASAVKLAREIVDFEEKNLERMKTYL